MEVREGRVPKDSILLNSFTTDLKQLMATPASEVEVRWLLKVLCPQHAEMG